MNYKITNKVGIGQYSEDVTKNINTSFANLEKHMPLVLTTAQRIGLDITLKTPNRIVFDVTENRWYKWAFVSGTYNWKPVSFIENSFNSTVSRVYGTYVFPDNDSEVVLSDVLGRAYNPANETMIVVLDGTVLAEGVHYTYNTLDNMLRTTGVWYKGQQMTVIIMFSEKGDENLGLSDILNRLAILEGETEWLYDNKSNVVTFRIWE